MPGSALLWQVTPRPELAVLPSSLLRLLRRIVDTRSWLGPVRISWDEVRGALFEATVGWPEPEPEPEPEDAYAAL